jgi:hypothetical protein
MIKNHLSAIQILLVGMIGGVLVTLLSLLHSNVIITGQCQQNQNSDGHLISTEVIDCIVQNYHHGYPLAYLYASPVESEKSQIKPLPFLADMFVWSAASFFVIYFAQKNNKRTRK